MLRYAATGNGRVGLPCRSYNNNISKATTGNFSASSLVEQPPAQPLEALVYAVRIRQLVGLATDLANQIHR